MKSFGTILLLFVLCSADKNLLQKKGESLQDYATRLLARHTYESNDEYEVRIACYEAMLPDIPIWKNYEYLKYITIENTVSYRPSYEPKYLDNLIQTSEENSTQYYTRLFERQDEDDFQYMERVAILRGLLRSHHIWLNKQFVEFVKPNVVGYRGDLKQKDGESNENYYKRLLARHTYESNDEYEVRIAFLEPFTPDLPIWKNYEYLNFITLEETTTERPPYEPRYLEEIAQNTGESLDKYYERIFTWYPDEDDFDYMERVSILRGVLKYKNIWRNNEFMRYVTPNILKRYPRLKSRKQNQGRSFT